MIAPPAIVAAAGVDLGRLIAVLECLETGGNWDHTGGALQFTVAAWKEDTGLSFTLARNRQAAEMTARARLERFCRISRRFGIEPSVELLVGSWHHGLFGAMRRVKSGHPSDYMKRGTALYRDATFK